MPAKHTILVVENEENDRLFVTLAFEDIGLGDSVRVVPDGHEALSYLQGDGPYKDRSRYPLPHLVLLDLDLPRMSGFEVLRWIRCQSRFRSTIVIPLTSSSRPTDIETARKEGANDYLIKPAGIGAWRVMAWRVEFCWLQPPAQQASRWGLLVQA